MTKQEQINKAIGAHGLWKQRLNEAIKTGKTEFTPDKVEVDNQCEFGKWLYSLPAEDLNCEFARKVKALHADFHKEAASVLRLAVGGKQAEAEKGTQVNSKFAKISSELTVAMMSWKSKLPA